MQIGLIGCGNMGGGMARQLLTAGQTPVCFDPNPDTLERIRKAGAHTAASASALAQNAQIIICLLYTSDAADEYQRG